MNQRTPSRLATNRQLTADDLAEIDALLAEILAGPGEDIGEKTFATFALSESVELGPPQEFIADNAGVEPDPPLAGQPQPVDIDDELDAGGRVSKERQ
jgi:hypothetical protein